MPLSKLPFPLSPAISEELARPLAQPRQDARSGGARCPRGGHWGQLTGWPLLCLPLVSALAKNHGNTSSGRICLKSALTSSGGQRTKTPLYHGSSSARGRGRETALEGRLELPCGQERDGPSRRPGGRPEGSQGAQGPELSRTRGGEGRPCPSFRLLLSSITRPLATGNSNTHVRLPVLVPGADTQGRRPDPPPALPAGRGRLQASV